MPNVLRHINPAQYELLAGFLFSYWVVNVNRKQKKAKRLKATQHTKSQARAYFTPHEEESIKKWQDGQNEWYVMIQSELQPSKPIIRVWHVVVVIIAGVVLWLIM
ncbi:hypothetical protein [Acinetobacter johnsonii]|uniref:hypothetical protein n=1 Tax=Acinetobacter johnsonii TaxID=40214 RepID=UPI000F67F046|nr:hypothetical protein [Acinetobacter johnsonii]